MIAATLAGWVGEALVASALLIALVLIVRVPVRRAFGARVGYALWLLPVLRLLLPPLPANWHLASAATPIGRVGETITVIVLPDTVPASAAPAAASSPSLAALLLAAWALVAAGFLAFHLVRHLRFCRGVLAGGVTVDRIARVRVIASDAAAGPMAFGILRPCVAVPRDFAERFDADERALALAHELGHHARGDLFANWIALGMLALHWFNPLVWRAFRAFRADQELANDARVLAGRSAYDRHAYACAIVKAAHGQAIGAACHLHSVHDLKGRLLMLRAQISPRRFATGAALVAAVCVAALGLTASGTSAAERFRTQVADATGIALPPAVTPVTPVTPVTLVSSGSRRIHRVVIVRNGTRTIYEGEEARRYIASHPAPTTPTPPVPPTPPTAPAAPTPPQPPRGAVVISDDGVAPIAFAMPQITSAACGTDRGVGELVRHSGPGGREIVICTDRIARRATAAERHAEFAQLQAHRFAANADRIRLAAMRHAIDSLRQTRAGMAANATIPADAHADAVESLGESIRELEAEMAQPD